MPSSGYRKQTVDFGDMALDLQRAAASFTKMSAAAASFVSFVGAFKAFELQVVKVNSAVGGTAQTFKALSDTARNFALVSKYSAGEAASSMVMLAQAGFTAQEAMSAMPSVLELAQASMENLDLVADTVASTIRTYNLAATDASRVTNLFAASAVNSLATVNKLAFSFRQVGPVAAELGLSVEQTAAALDILYNRGLRGEQAGTALRNILIRLIKPTEDTYDAFYRLGIALNDSNGQLRNYQDILKDLGTKKVSDTYLTKMFGREALAGAKTLIAATTGEYQKMLETITDTNTAARMANAQMKTMDGSLKLIRNSLTELGIIIGESVGPVVKTVADYMQSFAITLRTMDKDTVSTVKNLAVFTSSIYLVQKAITSTYAKLVPFAAKVNDLLSEKGLKSTWSWVTGTAAGKTTNGMLTQQGLVQLWNIAQQGGKDWYNNMNEAYKAMSGGKGLAIQYAADIKKMSSVQMEATKSTLKLASSFKALVVSLKGIGLAFLKLVPVIAVAWGAFKLYDNWAKERERKAQLKEDLFPELTIMVDKIKEAKLAVNKDLPDVASAYKANMEAMNVGQRGQLNAASFFKAYGLTAQNIQKMKGMGFNSEEILNTIYYSRVKNFANKLKETIIKDQKLGVAEFYSLGEEMGLDYNVLKNFWEGYDDAYEKVKNLQLAGEQDRVNSYIKAFFVGRAKDVIEAIGDGVKESNALIKKAAEQTFQDLKKEQELIANALKLGSNSYISGIITNQALNNKSVKNITDAYVRFIYGIPAGVDINTWFKDNFNEARKKFDEAKRADQDKLLKDFRESSFFKALSADLQQVIRVPMVVDGELQVSPVDMTAQNAVIAQLKKQYADLLSDYRLSWEILSQEEIAQEKIAKLQREISVNNQNLAVTTDKILKDIFKTLGKDVDAKMVETLLKSRNTVTGEILNKEKLIEDLTKSLKGEQLKLVTSKVEELELQYRIAAEKDKELRQEQKMNGVVEGRIRGLKQFRDALNQQIQEREYNAETGSTFKNLWEGVETGALKLQNDIDTFYEMGEKGMEGFANYMTDSMNDIVENWGKGWNSMRDALKSTLTDMLKELSRYFMKQAVYMSITGLTSVFGGSTTVSPGDILPNGQKVPPVPASIPSFRSAKGSAWFNGLQTFANGGIINSPTLFNTRSGKGLMGEAGPEAIMPLKRDSQGRLGVVSSSGSSLNYAPTFNINMTTGTVDSETSQRNTSRMTKELDNKVKDAVLLVIAKEKRPGGLLYSR